MSSEGRGKLLDTLDVAAKTLAALAAVAATYVASTWQTRMSATNLLSQREQAESQLRASMFSNLIGPVAGPQKDQRIPLDREQLLVELLALNFHEHFEVKPLLLYIDQEIVTGRATMGPDAARRARHSLRSVARRVAARQLALLIKEGGNARSAGTRARIDELTVAESPASPEQEQQLKALREAIEAPAGGEGGSVGGARQVVREMEKSFRATSPDHKYTLYVTVSSADWENETFEISASVAGNGRGDDGTPEHAGNSQTFTLTWYDFPFIDNTLLADGNRFSIVLSSVNAAPETVLKYATLQLVWFPKNFFTPRERPLDYDKFLELVGKKETD